MTGELALTHLLAWLIGAMYGGYLMERHGRNRSLRSIVADWRVGSDA
jgi:hypothetical protein